jgi:NitT/TauT family transport system substrate-binding protein
LKRIIGILICFLVIVLIAIGILAGKGKKEKGSDLKKITVAEVAHSIFYAPMYVADSLGYFEEEGIDADIILTSGADAVAAAVISGDAEIGFCGSEQSIYIYNGGEKDYLINFAGLTKRDGSFIVGRTDKDFKITDLKGSHIIAGREGGMPAMTLAYTLNENGIKLSDLNFDTSIAFASMSGAFISGTGDYVALFEPTALQLEKQGYGHVVASLGKLGGEVPYTTFQAKKSYLDDNSDIIKGFTKAIQKGLDYTFSHSDNDIAKAITDYFPDVSINDLTEVIKRYRENDSWYSTTYITEEGFNRVQDIMKNSNKLDSNAPFTKLVNNDYSKK